MLYPGSMTPTGGPDFSNTPTLKMVLDIGDAAFKMALPVLAGFIAYGMAGSRASSPACSAATWRERPMPASSARCWWACWPGTW